MLDVGAGTGVLSVAGTRLGYRVTAIDLEASCRERCRLTAEANAVPVRVLPVRLEQLEDRFPLVVANLDPQTAPALAGPLQRVVAPGGVLILGGFRTVDADAVASRYDLGVRRVVTAEDGDWAALVLACPPGTPVASRPLREDDDA